MEEQIKSPVEIEKELLEQAQRDAEARANDPMLVASTTYGMYIDHFKNAIDKLSSRQLRRLMKALVEYPLNVKKYNHVTQVEKEMFAVGNTLLEAKFIMIMSTYNNSPEIQTALHSDEPAPTIEDLTVTEFCDTTKEEETKE